MVLGCLFRTKEGIKQESRTPHMVAHGAGGAKPRVMHGHQKSMGTRFGVLNDDMIQLDKVNSSVSHGISVLAVRANIAQTIQSENKIVLHVDGKTRSSHNLSTHVATDQFVHESIPLMGLVDSAHVSHQNLLRTIKRNACEGLQKRCNAGGLALISNEGVDLNVQSNLVQNNIHATVTGGLNSSSMIAMVGLVDVEQPEIMVCNVRPLELVEKKQERKDGSKGKEGLVVPMDDDQVGITHS